MIQYVVTVIAFYTLYLHVVSQSVRLPREALREVSYRCSEIRLHLFMPHLELRCSYPDLHTSHK
jgi:hypothetical protein